MTLDPGLEEWLINEPTLYEGERRPAGNSPVHLSPARTQNIVIKNRFITGSVLGTCMQVAVEIGKRCCRMVLQIQRIVILTA